MAKVNQDSQIEKVRSLGKEYESKYHGCAQGTYAAIADTLGIFDANVFQSLIGQTAGAGDMGIGSCGAMAGSVAVLGQLFGKPRIDLQQEDVGKVMSLVQQLGDDFLKRYGSYTCHEIQKKVLGQSFNLRDHDELMKFLDRDDTWKCGEVCGNAAAKTVEIVLDTQNRHKDE